MADEIAPRAGTGEAVPHGESRASYEDRDRVVEVLRVSAGDGRLTSDELDERVEAALTARTYNELAALVCLSFAAMVCAFSATCTRESSSCPRRFAPTAG